MREQSDLLDHVAHAAAQFVRIALRDVLALVDDPSRCRLDHAVDQSKRRALPATGRSDEDEDLAGVDVEVKVLDRRLLDTRIRLRHVLELDEWLSAH